MVDLERFCSTDKPAPHLNKPFSDGAFSYACDGHLILRVPLREDVTKKRPEQIKLNRMFFGNNGQEYGPLPDYEPLEKEKCESCKGSGVCSVCDECAGAGDLDFESERNTYCVECKSCRGRGSIAGGTEQCDRCGGDGEVLANEWEFVDIGDDELGLALGLLEKIKELPRVKLGTLDKKAGYVPFIFDGGDGLIMTRRR